MWIFKGHSAQHFLPAKLEKWKRPSENKKIFGAPLTDLSKAFDCLPTPVLMNLTFLS